MHMEHWAHRKKLCKELLFFIFPHKKVYMKQNDQNGTEKTLHARCN